MPVLTPLQNRQSMTEIFLSITLRTGQIYPEHYITIHLCQYSHGKQIILLPVTVFVNLAKAKPYLRRGTLHCATPIRRACRQAYGTLS